MAREINITLHFDAINKRAVRAAARHVKAVGSAIAGVFRTQHKEAAK